MDGRGKSRECTYLFVRFIDCQRRQKSSGCQSFRPGFGRAKPYPPDRRCGVKTCSNQTCSAPTGAQEGPWEEGHGQGSLSTRGRAHGKAAQHEIRRTEG